MLGGEILLFPIPRAKTSRSSSTLVQWSVGMVSDWITSPKSETVMDWDGGKLLGFG